MSQFQPSNQSNKPFYRGGLSRSGVAGGSSGSSSFGGSVVVGSGGSSVVGSDESSSGSNVGESGGGSVGGNGAGGGHDDRVDMVPFNVSVPVLGGFGEYFKYARRSPDTPFSIQPPFQIQVINSKGMFNNQFSLHLDTWERNSNKKVRVVSIIGPQGSGKSTLLNGIFNTQFQMMDVSQGWHRTTEGLWVSNDRAAYADIPETTVVMDVEGVDGNENPDARTAENRALLFSLCMSGVVIVNLNENSLNRNRGGCLPMLEAVFREARLIKDPNGARTVLLFVVRNYNGQSAVSGLSQTVSAILAQAWGNSRIAGGDPAQQKLTPADLFVVMVYALPNLFSPGLPDGRPVFQPQLLEELRDVFHNQYHPMYAFRYGTKQINTPRDLSILAPEVWEQVQRSKAIMVPSRSLLSAMARCMDHRDRTLDTMNGHVEALLGQLDTVRFEQVPDAQLQLMRQQAYTLAQAQVAGQEQARAAAAQADPRNLCVMAQGIVDGAKAMLFQLAHAEGLTQGEMAHVYERVSSCLGRDLKDWVGTFVRVYLKKLEAETNRRAQLQAMELAHQAAAAGIDAGTALFREAGLANLEQKKNEYGREGLSEAEKARQEAFALWKEAEEMGVEEEQRNSQQSEQLRQIVEKKEHIIVECKQWLEKAEADQRQNEFALRQRQQELEQEKIYYDYALQQLAAARKEQAETEEQLRFAEQRLALQKISTNEQLEALRRLQQQEAERKCELLQREQEVRDHQARKEQTERELAYAQDQLRQRQQQKAQTEIQLQNEIRERERAETAWHSAEATAAQRLSTLTSLQQQVQSTWTATSNTQQQAANTNSYAAQREAENKRRWLQSWIRSPD